MGIPGLLPEILGSAGHPFDLRVLSPGVSHSNHSDARVPLRIGVDVSTWIHRASYGHNGQLYDERHLSNYGRAELLQIQNRSENDGASLSKIPPEVEKEYIATCVSHIIGWLQTLQHTTNAEVLVVLDGAMPPVKAAQVESRQRKRKQAEMERDQPVDRTGNEDALERRFLMSKRAGAGKYFNAIYVGVLDQLRINKIPFLVAPYEADAQLAYLSLNCSIDLIVTEDSDLLAYGASPLLYKLVENISKGDPVGIMIRKEDLSAKKDCAGTSLDLTDFTPLMMAVMFAIVGSDYNIKTKLKGVGIKAACNIVREVFFNTNDEKQKINHLEEVFKKAFNKCRERSSLTEDFKESYKQAFIEALLMFRHPVVFDPINGYSVMGLTTGDPELMSYVPYWDLFKDQERREKIVGKVVEKDIAVCIAEGWISPRTMRPYDGASSPIPLQIATVVARLPEETETS